jgi:hypothetical protein
MRCLSSAVGTWRAGRSNARDSRCILSGRDVYWRSCRDSCARRWLGGGYGSGGGVGSVVWRVNAQRREDIPVKAKQSCIMKETKENLRVTCERDSSSSSAATWCVQGVKSERV